MKTDTEENSELVCCTHSRITVFERASSQAARRWVTGVPLQLLVLHGERSDGEAKQALPEAASALELGCSHIRQLSKHATKGCSALLVPACHSPHWISVEDCFKPIC